MVSSPGRDQLGVLALEERRIQNGGRPVQVQVREGEARSIGSRIDVGKVSNLQLGLVGTLEVDDLGNGRDVGGELLDVLQDRERGWSLRKEEWDGDKVDFVAELDEFQRDIFRRRFVLALEGVGESLSLEGRLGDIEQTKVEAI